MGKIKLWYSPGSVSLAVHIALEEIGCEYEAVQVSVAKGENRLPDYLAINPRGRVPTLQLPSGDVLTECSTILIWLSRQFPERNLLPAPDSGMVWYRALEWMSWMGSAVHQTGVRPVLRPGKFISDEGCQQKLRGESVEVLRGYLSEISERLIGNEWVLGEQWSLLDAYFYVFYQWAARAGLDLSEFPDFQRIMAKTEQRLAVQTTVRAEGLNFVESDCMN